MGSKVSFEIRSKGRTLLLSAACLLLAGAAALASDAPVDPGDFQSLPEYASRGGALDATLVAESKSVTVDGVRLDTLVFNGAYGGPVLRVKPGDRMRIHLVNHIDQPINLHFHGTHTSPLGRGDNIHGVTVKPGADFHYVVDIPKSQPGGLYWYHTHVHGLAELEVNGGLSGALIVEGIEKTVPKTVGLKTRLMVLKTFTLDRPDDPEVKRLHGVVQSVDGQAHAVLAASAGATEFWRVSNQSPNDYYHLSAPGVRFHVVAMDGVPTAHDVETATLDIPPAGRMEALASIPKAGDYRLLSGSTPTGSGRSMTVNRELATLVAAPAAPDEPEVREEEAERLLGGEYRICRHPGVDFPGPSAAADLRTAKSVTPRLIRFTQKPGEEVYMINDKTYDHRRIDTRVRLGSVEEWTIRNETQDMHVFHIHQVHFQVVSINGQAQPFDRLLDTVRVPEMGEVVVRIAFTDPRIVGRFVYHCHVLKHEDKGMMANIEVYDPHPGARRLAPEVESHAGHGA